MLCPKCHLENPQGTSWCDCGYNFSTGTVESHHRLKTASRDDGVDYGAYFSSRKMVSTSIVKGLHVVGTRKSTR